MQASRVFFGAIVFMIAVVAWLARTAAPPAAGLPIPLAEQVPPAPAAVPVAQEPAPPVLQLDGMAAPEDPAPVASAAPVPSVASAEPHAPSRAGIRVAALPVQARAQPQPQPQPEVLRPVHRPRHAKALQARRVRTASARAKLVARAQQRRGVIVSVVTNKALWLP